MRYSFFFSLLLFFASCSNSSNDVQQLKTQIDSLQNKIDNTYKPGLGEFMSDIQVHHAKLWFAGINNNWKLADFEVGEIKESLDYIQKYCTDRPEVKAIGMIDGPIDSISNAVQQKNLLLFKNSFTLLTNTCNNCHRATQHEFNVIIIPSAPPVSNQNFKLVQ